MNNLTTCISFIADKLHCARQRNYVCVNAEGVPLHYDYVLHAFQDLLRKNDLPKNSHT